MDLPVLPSFSLPTFNPHMKFLPLLAALLFCPVLFASDIIVYAKGQFAVLDSAAANPVPKDSGQAGLLAAYQTDLAQPAPFAPPIQLIAPPGWGKTVPGALGRLEFHDKFRGGFIVRVTLAGLAPKHRYILTLNGNPKLAGNDRLVDVVPGMETERYFDFLTITTEKDGHYDATFAIALATGPYDVRFYVKDTADFKIVLYHDYFKFAVE